MATLSISERARIQWVLDYISNSGGGGRFLDTKAADELAKVFQSNCGFRCGCGNFQQELKNAPVLTLLRAILCGSEGLVVVSPEGAVVIDPADGVIPPIVIPDAAAAPCVDLGTACTYGVLAGSTVTNTGATNVVGDLGLWPGTSVTGFPPGVVSGTQHINDAAAEQAQLDLTTAYDFAAAQTVPAPTIVAGDIGGQTLTPGIYKSTSSLEISSGNLTLDAQNDPDACFLFQMTSSLTTTTGTQVILANGAQAKNVFWQVGSSGVLGTGSVFRGTIMALTSITATTNGIIDGRLLARNGATTLDTNAILTPPC